MELTRKDAAAALGIDVTTLDSWCAKGCPADRQGKGRPASFVLADVVRWRIEYETARALESVTKSAETADLDALRARKMAAEATLREIQVGRAKADLIPAFEYKTGLSSLLRAAQVQTCEVLPARAARRCVGETDETRLREILRDEARAACQELADADPDEIFAGVVAQAQAAEIAGFR